MSGLKTGSCWTKTLHVRDACYMHLLKKNAFVTNFYTFTLDGYIALFDQINSLTGWRHMEPISF